MNATADEMLMRAVGDPARLPSPRGAVLELLRIAADDNASVGDVARVAMADPALAARLIHAANGAAMRNLQPLQPRSSQPIGSIEAAVMRLGFSATRQIALACSLVGANGAGVCAQFDFKGFWTASLLRALAARALAVRLRTGDPQEAFACGLLAEIGALAFATTQPAAYGELLAAHGAGSGASLRDEERARFGIDHGRLGELLLERWSMPQGLVAAVRGYFDPPLSAVGPNRVARRQSLTLLLAESVARAAAAPAGERDAWTHMALESASLVEADNGMLDDAVREVAGEAPAWAGLLELPAPRVVTTDFPGYVDVPDAESSESIGLRILAVDDDESERLLIQWALEKAGHRVSLACDGREALASVAEAPPQLVITDVEMPRMNGLQFCRALRASRLGASLQVIALTGRERHEDLVDCIQAGANDFVGKSAPREVLLARVRAAARSVHCRERLENELHSARELSAELAFGQRKALLGAAAA